MSHLGRHQAATSGSNRITSTFRKKIRAHAVVLHFMHYNINFVRSHKTLRQAPAMAAGVTGKLWEVAELRGSAA